MTTRMALVALLCLLIPARAAFGQATGSILLPEANSGSVINIEPGGNLGSAPRFATGLSFPTAVCQGPGGHIYVTEAGSGEVTIITGGGDFTGGAPFATGLSSPFGLLCTDSQILVSENTSSQITDITQGGDAAGFLPFANVTTPADILQDSAGRILATSFGGGVFDITAGGAGVLLTADDGLDDGAIGLAEHVGQILVALWIGNRVASINGASNYTNATTQTSVADPLNLLSVNPTTLLVATWNSGSTTGTVFNIASGIPVVFATGVRPFTVAEMVVTTRQCGNGIVEGAESCDDGNTNENDACTSSCLVARCGDGVVQTGVEACDDGNTLDSDGCLSDCTLAACGDSFINVGVEECDDGNLSNEDECLATCMLATCGDAFVNAGVEECDDGNNLNSDTCTDACLLAICGDGFIQIGVEECDDANEEDNDSCRNTCTTPACGNFIIDPQEECDDGNMSNEDDCLNTCFEATCGDGFTHAEDEECDDANDDDIDECSDECLITFCGDGEPKLGEACDDGNESDNDECRTDCEIAFCGDGFLLYGTEDCDDGNLEDGDGCSRFCFKEFKVVGCQSYELFDLSRAGWACLFVMAALIALRRRKSPKA